MQYYIVLLIFEKSIKKQTFMSNKQKRFILPEDEIPKYWYNIQADMKNKPMPPLNPATREPLKPEDLYPILQKNYAIRSLTRPIHG